MTDRQTGMIAAAEMLARVGFARIGWATHAEGKAAGSRSGHRWQSDAIDDPALVPNLLHGARNALVIPKGRAIIIDIDKAEAWAELAAAGLPPTLTIDSPTQDHGHVYGWASPDVDMTTIPGAFAHGEIRRLDPRTGTASMVLGPWSLRADGVYKPRGTVRTIAELPGSVIDYLISSARVQDSERSAARGPQDVGWTITAGRHDYLVSRARWLRGNGLSGERLVDELLRLDRERCDPPLADLADRGEAEIRRIAEWTETRIADDQPNDIPGLADDLVEVSEPERGETWPEPLVDAAFHGVAGELVRAVVDSTEADPAGLLGSVLATAGALFGRYRTLYQGSAQASNIYVALVGDSSTGRKGTAGSVVREIFGAAYPEWDSIAVPGLGSGEGLIRRLKPTDERNEHRALVLESELGRLLTVMARDGSTLSPVLRDAWDGAPMGRFLAREDAVVLWHHVGLIGHVTPVELRAKLTSVDAANGFGNRFLWLAVRRTRLVPFPGNPRQLIGAFLDPLHRAIQEAHTHAELAWTPAAADRWEGLYAELATRPRLGLAGAITARAEAQVARLALIYALLDRATAVDVVHLNAGIAVWEYAERSAIYLFGESTGNRHADLVLRRLGADAELDWQGVKQETGLRLGAEIDDLIRVLKDANLIDVVKVARADKTGRRRTVLRLRNSRNGRNGAVPAQGSEG